MNSFKPGFLPLLIGSLPVDDHGKAIEMVLKSTPEIPLWVQLPFFKEEGMIEQFIPGIPGLTVEQDKFYLDTSGEKFNEELLLFYENYLSVVEGQTDLRKSTFALTRETARGFFVFTDKISRLSNIPIAVKGQITGPITFCTAVKDQGGRMIFYNDQARDCAVKLLAMKAAWQVQVLSELGPPPIIFFDEPALAGFGSSAFLSITHEEIADCLKEVVDAVHAQGGMAGIHVCANTDWSIVLKSPADIISFDAYAFFDKFLLYPDDVIEFLKSGGIIAWGIIPTLNPGDIEKETADSIVANLEAKIDKIESLGIERKIINSQSLITPSCGTGSLSFEHAARVLKLTREVSDRLMKKN